MSHFPPAGPFGGPYPYQGAQPQYTHPPPPQMPNYIVPHQGYPQQQHPQSYGGPPMPQGGPMVQYANAGAYQGNGHFNPPLPTSAIQHQQPNQPYYGYGQYGNTVPPAQPFGVPTPLPVYNAAAPPQGQNNGFVQSRPSSAYALPSKVVASAGMPSIKAVSNRPQHLSNGNNLGANKIGATDAFKPPNGANFAPSRPFSGHRPAENISSGHQIVGSKAPIVEAASQQAKDLELVTEKALDDTEMYSPDTYTPPQPAQHDTLEEIVDLNTPEQSGNDSHLPEPPAQPSPVVLDTPPSNNVKAIRPSTQQAQTTPATQTEKPANDMGAAESRVQRAAEDRGSAGLRDKKRDAAKAAIRDLHGRQIGYHELVDETIDAHLLRQLYDELGIAIPVKPASSASQAAPHSHAAPNPFAQSAAAKATQATASRPGLTSGKPAAPAADLSEGEVSREASRRESPLAPASQAPAKASPAPLKKPPAAAPVSKPIERKDYIAKLLAAKAAVKQSSAARVEKTNASQSPTLPRQPSAGAAPDKAATPPAPAAAVAGTAKALSDGAAVEKGSDAKGTDSTELARQRLQALQSDGHAQLAQAVDRGSRTLAQQPPGDAMQLDQPPPSAPALVAAAFASQKSPITPDASFFALGDRKSWGGLPGLGGFELPGLGAAKAPAPPAPSQTSSTEKAPVPPTEPMSRQSSGSRPRTGEHPLPAKPTSSAASATQAEAPLPGAGAPTAAATATETRKRAVALDFIDGPAEHPQKRPMMSKEPISLVIEVSDEEEEAQRSSSAAPRPPPLRSNSGGAKSFRDGPPLSGLPTGRAGPPTAPAAGARTATPPKGGQSAKGLAQTEEQIRILQQRIAEMESRKKAKQQSSSASTPRETTTTTAAAAPPTATAEDLAVASKSQALEDQRQTLATVSQALVAQQASLAAAQTQVVETLETGQKSQALIRAKVDAEARAAARATNQQQREKRLARKVQLESALPQLDAQMAAAQVRLDEMLRQQQEIQAEIQRGDEGRQALLTELDSLSALLVERMSESPEPESSPSDESRVSPERTEEQPDDTVPERVVAEKVTGKELPVQREPSQGPVEKETAEARPVVGSSLQQPPRDEPRHIETSPQRRFAPPSPEKEPKGLTPNHAADEISRSPSVSVLGQFSPPRESSVPVHEAGHAIESAPRRQPTDVTMHEETMDISDSSSDEGQIIASRQGTHEPLAAPSDADMELDEDEDEEYEPPAADVVPVVPEHDEASESDSPRYEAASMHDDADMDLDPASGGEDDEYEPEDVQQPDTVPLVTDLDINTGRPHSRQGSSVVRSEQDLEMAIDTTENDPDATQLSGNFAPNGTHQSLAQASSPSSNNASEEGEIEEAMDEGSDGEYEPPDTTPPLDNDQDAAGVPAGPAPDNLPVTAPDHDIGAVAGVENGPAGSAPSLPGNADSSIVAKEDGDATEVPAVASTASSTHFEPYASPLARFTSYRYHPEYVSSVPGGFRSMTYSHNINTHTELCPWELKGGACNDRACRFQHFRDMPLTDNTILLQLGSVQEGSTPEEKEAYISGLKEIITHMRSRNLKDVSAVLAEIVAYRARFLGDRSRVLTNIV